MPHSVTIETFGYEELTKTAQSQAISEAFEKEHLKIINHGIRNVGVRMGLSFKHMRGVGKGAKPGIDGEMDRDDLLAFVEQAKHIAEGFDDTPNSTGITKRGILEATILLKRILSKSKRCDIVCETYTSDPYIIDFDCDVADTQERNHINNFFINYISWVVTPMMQQVIDNMKRIISGKTHIDEYLRSDPNRQFTKQGYALPKQR
jgi:hypothetical protein